MAISMRWQLAAVVALIPASCAPLFSPVYARCPLTRAVVPTSPLPRLDGGYELTFVNTSGRYVGRVAVGTMRLERRAEGESVIGLRWLRINLTETDPYLGTADLDLKSVVSVYEGELNTVRPHPGVTLKWSSGDAREPPQLELGIGSAKNQHEYVIF